MAIKCDIGVKNNFCSLIYFCLTLCTHVYNIFGSVHLSGRARINCDLPSHFATDVHAAEWLILGLSLPSAKQNHHDIGNTVQDLCVCHQSGGICDQEPCAAVD